MEVGEISKSMKTAGLLGGMSWESTVTYYQFLNRGIRERLGGLHSAPCIVYSVDFQPVAEWQQAGEWDKAGEHLAHAARGLQAAGADFVVLCTNTMHEVADVIAEDLAIPMLHIADPTGETIAARDIRSVGLLGTRYTMEMGFYRDRLKERFGIEALVPDERERDAINRIIFDELCLGGVEASSRETLVATIEELRSRGAEAVILGCTELGLLVENEAGGLPLLDTTRLHAAAALDVILGERDLP